MMPNLNVLCIDAELFTDVEFNVTEFQCCRVLLMPNRYDAELS